MTELRPSVAPSPVRRRTAWAMWALGVAVYLTAVFHRNGLAVGALLAERRFHVGPPLLGTVVAVQLGIYAAMQIPAGTMADRFGSRRMLTAAAVLMGTGELVFAFSTSIGVALLGRALIGLGDAVTFLSILRLVQNWFPLSRYGLLAALTSLVGSIGQLVSTVPLHAGLAHLGWSTTFALTALVTLVTAVPVAFALHDRPGLPPGRPRAHAVADHPGLRAAVREVMGVPGTWRGMWVHFALTGSFAVFTALWGYPFLVRALHESQSRASSALALVVVAAAVGSVVVGIVMVRTPARRPAIAYASGAATFSTWVAVLAVGPAQAPGWLVVLLLVATGFGAPASAVAFDLARQANADERGGTATGVVNIGGFTGAVIADLVIGFVLGHVGHGHGENGFRVALSVIPLMVAIGMAGLWWYGRPAPDVQSPAPKLASSLPSETSL